MGGNRRNGGVRLIPAWCATLGACKAEAVAIRARCDTCSGWWQADLDRMIAGKGPAYSLWDRRGKCQTLGCKGRVLFLYTSGGGTPYRPFKTRD